MDSYRDRAPTLTPGPLTTTEVSAGWASEAEFTTQIEQYRRELHLHCYRMLGSFEEAEDLVQETLLRAWRRRDTYEGRATLRAWLYRIATNACLDHLRRNPRRPTVHPGRRSPYVEVAWLQPYPDQLLDEVAPSEQQPDAVVVARESVALGFLTLIQLLPPRQRAALILVDVLGWSAAEVAALLDSSVAATNSMLQRARATLQKHRPSSRFEWTAHATPTEQEQTLLHRYIDATERADLPTLVALLHDDIRGTMPPDPRAFEGRDAMAKGLAEGCDPAMGEWRCIETWANRLPAAACYLRKPGETEFHAFSIDVLRIEDSQIVEMIVFEGKHFPTFGLPLVLPA